MTPNAVMIFAAGFGTRMRPLTENTPKPMIKVAGQPLIDHAITLAEAAGAERIVSNTHFLASVMASHLEQRGVSVVHEDPDILDTGGGLKNAADLLGNGPVWTQNPDVMWRGPNPLTFALNSWDAEYMDALLVCVPLDQALGSKSRGDFVFHNNGKLHRGAGHIYTGVQIIKPEIVCAIPETAFSLNAVWDALILQDRCFGCLYPGKWCDVGHPDGITLAESLLRGEFDD